MRSSSSLGPVSLMCSSPPTPEADAPGAAAVVVGCGNVLRGDDGVGPECVRQLIAGGLPAGVTAIDAGTSGADVILKIRGVDRVILVDACRSGGPPGSLVSLSDADLAELPAAGPLDVHAFRWVDAVRLARALAGERSGPTISARLVEAADFTPGRGLSPPVAAAVARLVTDLRAELASAPVAAPGA